MSKVVFAKDLDCCECEIKKAVAFFPVCDPDIPSYPYCRECLDNKKLKLLVEMFNMPIKESNGKVKRK